MRRSRPRVCAARIAELRPCGVAITVSVGVAHARGVPGEVFADVFGRAARAAVAARQGGCDRVVTAEVLKPRWREQAPGFAGRVAVPVHPPSSKRARSAPLQRSA